MPPTSTALTRRNVLKLTGGSLSGLSASGLAAGSGNDRVEVNVGYAAASGREAALAAASEVVRTFGSIEALTIRLPRPAAESLEKRSDVRYVEENGEIYALAQTLPWGVNRVEADLLHGTSDDGSGAHVAIIDTGIDSDHPDLQANVGTGKDFTGTGSWDDDNGHGTHCAGIADAVNNSIGVVGVATEATLHAVKVLDSGGYGTASGLAAGIEHVADQGWNVANMSLGGLQSSAVQDAVQYADGKDVLLVAAAGNDGPCTDCVEYPAAYSEVLAVSATDQNDDLADFSSQGPEIDLAAPGENIYSTVPGGYDTKSGTSMASPHVAGAGALLMAEGHTNDEARYHLTDAAFDIGLSNNEQGFGLLDAEAAVTLRVETERPSSIGTYSATLEGELKHLSGASSAEVYFRWGKNGTTLPNTTPKETLSSRGSFSATISGLESDTIYHYYAVADGDNGEHDGGMNVSFMTDSGDGTFG